MSLMGHLLPRQVSTNPSSDDNNPNNDRYYGWWYSGSAYAIKWAVIGAIFFLFIALFLGGYLHAKRRMKKGLAPLRYHRWLIPRRQRLHFHSQHPELPNPYPPAQYAYYSNHPAPYRPGYGEQRGHVLGPMVGYGGARMGPDGAAPPPAYGHGDWAPVPAYEPPRGGSKVNPDQGGNNGSENANAQVGVGGGSSQQGQQGPVYEYGGGDLGTRVVR